jgi:prephenate dehydrogenase
VEETDPVAVVRVRAMWEAAGALVTEMDALHHDAVLAATSHLPHMLAFTLVECLSRLDDTAEVFEYAAGGFRDFTRIASSDPVMWRDICLANGDAIRLLIEHFIENLRALDQAIGARDGERLRRHFEAAKRTRDRYLKH